MEDEIIQEVRRVRQKIESEAGNDLQKIHENSVKNRETYKQRLVSKESLLQNVEQ